jgi:uncharacterized circularly permuted ATP-grasp superfamily protein
LYEFVSLNSFEKCLSGGNRFVVALTFPRYEENHMQEQDWIFLKNTDMKCIRNRKGKTIKYRLKNSKFWVLAPFRTSYILEMVWVIKKYVGTLYKKNFVRNLENNCEDYLKNKCSTYKNRKRPFDTFCILASFVYLRYKRI